MKKKIVILGTAHLSSTPGKRSPDGRFREYAFSRAVCNEVKEQLNAAGVDCWIDWYDDDMKVSSQKQELEKRVEIVNRACKELGADKFIYCSIHVNAAGDGLSWKNATGFSVYTTNGNTKSDALAASIYKAAEGVLQPLGKKLRKDTTDGDPDYEADFYVLKKTACPAALTENFFQDCKEDVEWLESDEGFEAVVSYHVLGILNYLNKL